MSTSNSQLTQLFRREFELCNVSPGESVRVLYQAETRDGYVSAILDSLQTLDANVTSIQLPVFKHSMFPYGGDVDILDADGYLPDEPDIQRLLRNADMVVDATAEGLVHTKTTADILDGNARMLLVREPPAVLERMFPRESLKNRIERGEGMIQDAESMTITSDAGTDLSLELGNETPVIAQYGYTPEPGDWDNFPGGFLAAYPVDDSPNGTIILDVGDVVLPMGRYADTPIEIQIQDGIIEEIIGSHAIAELTRSYLSRWDTDDAYQTSHFGFGLDETGEWENLAFSDGQDLMGQDFRGYLGGFMWSTGPNRYVDRYTRSHFDIVHRNCSVWLDDNKVIDHGNVINDELAPDANGK